MTLNETLVTLVFLFIALQTLIKIFFAHFRKFKTPAMNPERIRVQKMFYWFLSIFTLIAYILQHWFQPSNSTNNLHNPPFLPMPFAEISLSIGLIYFLIYITPMALRSLPGIKTRIIYCLLIFSAPAALCIYLMMQIINRM